MGFWKNLSDIYRGSARTIRALPLLALVPVVFELLQHVVEVRIGMYASLDAAKALEHDPARMALGMAKIIGITLPVYWTARYLATADRRFAARFDPRAAGLFGLVLLFQAATAAISLFVLPQTGTVTLISFAAGLVLGALLAAWYAAAPLGNARLGPIASARLIAPLLVSTIALSVVAMLPLMIVHYAFAAVALVGPKAALWPALIVDSLLVGWLASVLAAITYVVAARAADHGGTTLMPAEGGVQPTAHIAEGPA